MKATLTFDLPEEWPEFKAHIYGPDFAAACFDLDNLLRGYIKHGHKFTSADDALDHIRTALHTCLDDHGVSLDMIE